MTIKPEDLSREEREAAALINESASAITLPEFTKLYQQKSQHDAGERRTGYGHDLRSAIQRGHMRVAREIAGSLMDRQTKRGASGPSTQFAGALYSLICAGAERGVSEADIRMWLQRELDCTDSLSIARTVEKYQPEALTIAK